jgi:hypothetical protein
MGLFISFGIAEFWCVTDLANTRLGRKTFIIYYKLGYPKKGA